MTTLFVRCGVSVEREPNQTERKRNGRRIEEQRTPIVTRRHRQHDTTRRPNDPHTNPYVHTAAFLSSPISIFPAS